MPTTKTSDELFHEIKLIGAQAAKLQDRIHACAVDCLLHAEVHGDARPMKALFNALPKSNRRMALLTWVEGFSPVFIAPDGETCGVRVEGVDKKYIPFNVDAAIATPYWEYTSEEVKLHGAGEYIGKAFAALAAFERDVKEGTFRGEEAETRSMLRGMIAVFGDETKLKSLKASDKTLKAA
tara:strand:+ start:1250 stop:1792 length:543 start_codon:yes stop_codon:yes gene_type:complete